MSDIEILNLYEFKVDGTVISKRTGMIISPCKQSSGYVRIMACNSPRKRFVRVHRFVALSHIPNPECYPFINHKNGIKDDNRVENLEWCTTKMNTEHAWKTGLASNKNCKRGNEHHASKFTDVDVLTIRTRLKNGEPRSIIFKDYNHISSWWSFRNICRGKLWRHIVV